jgi:lysophospholipase L1-like esterase
MRQRADISSRLSWRASAALAVLALVALPCEASGWTASWGAAPLPPSPAIGPFPATPTFSNQTIRQIVRITAGGERIRIRFTNEYGTRPLLIGAARVALADAKGDIQPGTERPLLFAGQASALVPAGSPYLSDALDFPVKALARLSISIYLPGDTGPCTCHAVGMQTTYVSDTGNFVSGGFAARQTVFVRAFISGVEISGKRASRAIVVLGDSISDGVGSTPDANRRWPDLLAERLAARKGEVAWGVINMGISGNRILNDGAGQSALARFDRDVLSVPGAAVVVIFEGVNDLGIGLGEFQGPMADLFKSMVPEHKPDAASMIAGYRQLIDRGHARGLKVFGATIVPYQGAPYYSAAGEAVRQQINAWIRTGGAFDAVLDFDAVVRDPGQPTQIAEPLQSGDHLHGSDKGYEAIAESIDLALFK